MSLAIKKFANGGSSEVRTYKRGNDEVDLNAFIRQAEVGFNDWLDRTDIKEKHKNEVRAAYQDMITRINDNPDSFVARLGGGFTNTAGITNNTRGFDSYGVAAGYLGDVLRNMQAYTNPKSQSNRTKYTRDSKLITPDIQKQIWGEDANSFIMLDNDSYDESTGRRGAAHRIAQTIMGLQSFRDKLKDIHDFETDEDYNHAIGRIDSAISTLQNSNPNDDWFALGQLGMTRMNQFLSTGQEKQTTPMTQEEQETATRRNNINNFENWMSNNRPFFIGQLASPISIGSQAGSATDEQKMELQNKLGRLSNDEIRDWILSYIVDPNYDFSQYPTLRKLYGGVPRVGLFSNSQYITEILAQAIRSGKAINIPNTSLYYFPDTFEEYPDKSSTVYVYDSNSKTIKQVDTQDIIDYRNQFFVEYQTANPQQGNSSKRYMDRYPQMYTSHKEGGVLKFQNSGKFIGNIGHVNTYGKTGWYEHGFSKWMNDLLLAAEQAKDKGAYAKMINDTQSAHSKLWKQWDQKTAYLGDNNSVGNYQQTIIDRFKWVNDKGVSNIRAQKLYTDPDNPYTGDSEGNHWQPDNYFAAQTDDRRVLGREGDFTPEQERQLMAQFKLRGYDFYLDNTDGYYKLNYIPEDEDITKSSSPQAYWETGEPDKPIDGSDFNEVTGDVTQQQDNTSKADLNETYIKLKGLGQGPNWLNLVREIGPNLLGASRLTGSILTNNKIARTVRDSIRPKVHDDYWLFSPVTGAFGEMQLRNRQGAEVLSQSHKPFTSDASLASARMLEGQRQANNLQHQGFLADNREIRRTQAEALQRQESNIARHSKLANDNIDAIITNNQTAAQLEASRLKQNWNSINNYLQEGEGRMRQRLAEDKDRYNQFLLQTGQFSAQQKRKHDINELMNAFRTYTALPGNETKTLTDFNNYTAGRYEQAIAAINTDYEMSQLANFGRVYGYGFTPPKDYTPYDRNKYDLTVVSSKHGGTLKLSSSQLIDKIIRKNEGNS